MNNNKLKFEFDFDEMIEGIKLGVMKELTDITYDNIEKSVIAEVRATLIKRFDLDWSDRMKIKDEIKEEAKDKIFKSVKNDIASDIKSKQKREFDEIVHQLSKDNENYIKEMENKIVEKAVGELYSNLVSKAQKELNQKLEQFTYKLMNNVGGNNVVVSDSGKEKVITKSEYDELIKRDEILSALENGGVDNWEWYGESIKQYFGDED